MAKSPELTALVDVLRASPILPDADLETIRAAMNDMTAAMTPPDGVRYEPTTIGGVPAEWALTSAAPSASGTGPVMLYFHGGAYCIGSVATHRGLVGRLALATGMRVLSLDYALAPEHPFPAAIDDAVAAYRALLAQGIDPKRIVLAGDSAGGGLTLATLLALRDAGAPLPAAGVCISPWLDMTGSGDSWRTRAAEDPMIGEHGLDRFSRLYLASADPRNPLASPVFADPKGLPPVLIHVGTAEVLLDDSTMFAKRARDAGVDVTLEVWDDMIHVWHAFAPALPEADRAISRIAEYLERRVKP
jgi:acetyl esterase/lipase